MLLSMIFIMYFVFSNRLQRCHYSNFCLNDESQGGPVLLLDKIRWNKIKMTIYTGINLKRLLCFQKLCCSVSLSTCGGILSETHVSSWKHIQNDCAAHHMRMRMMCLTLSGLFAVPQYQTVTDSTLTWLYRNQCDPAFTRLTFRTQTGNYLFITALWRQLCLSLFSLIVTLQIVFTFRQHTSASLSLKRLSHAAQTQATDITVSFYCYIIVIKRIWCIWIYLFVCGVIISIINILNLFCLLYFLF